MRYRVTVMIEDEENNVKTEYTARMLVEPLKPGWLARSVVPVVSAPGRGETPLQAMLDHAAQVIEDSALDTHIGNRNVRP